MKKVIIQNKERLDYLEGIIQSGLQSFFEVGKKIKAKGLTGYEKEMEIWETLFGNKE